MKQMKEDRNFILYLVLNLVTLGIYGIWFLHHLIKDINELCKDEGKRYHSPGILIYLLLSIITCGLYSIFFWYRIGDMLDLNARHRNCNVTITRGLMLGCWILNLFIHSIAGLVGMYFVIDATNTLAHDYNERLLNADTASTEEHSL